VTRCGCFLSDLTGLAGRSPVADLRGLYRAHRAPMQAVTSQASRRAVEPAHVRPPRLPEHLRRLAPRPRRERRVDEAWLRPAGMDAHHLGARAVEGKAAGQDRWTGWSCCPWSFAMTVEPDPDRSCCSSGPRARITRLRGRYRRRRRSRRGAAGRQGPVRGAARPGHDAARRPHAAIAGGRPSLFEWRRRHRWCANCGQPPTSPRRLEAHLPVVQDRALPAHRPGGDHAGRARRALPARPPGGLDAGMWSALAGFLEPGESLEEAAPASCWKRPG
jgi:NAD+ diphosphatase